MAKRWNVHHGNENLGLKTAKEIREALRKGTLDPFDKVSAEGSNIREDLIEVDEIFKETSEEDQEFTAIQQLPPMANQAYGAGAAQKARQQGQYQPSAQAMPPQQQAIKLVDPISRERDPSQPRTNAQPTQAAPVASASWRSEHSMLNLKGPADDTDFKDGKATQKRYYLIDKSKILGPLSAIEIQSLFNRNMLNQKVKVQRIGGTRSIPVAQFISSYSEDRLKELTDDGKLNQKVSSPSSKVLNELARAASAQKIAQDRKNKTYMVIGSIGLVLGALIFIIFEATRSSRKNDARDKEDVAAERSESGRRGNNHPKLLQKTQSHEASDDGDDGDPQGSRSSRKSHAQPAPASAPKKLAPPLAEAPREKLKTPLKQGKKANNQQAQNTPQPQPLPPATASASAPMPTAKSVAKTAPIKTQPQAPAAPSKKAEKDSPIGRALSSGTRGIQTIGPLSYSPAALESCPTKCTLTLRDASGATIKAVFFKTAYYDALKKSSNGVFLTGNTRKESGELTIFIQDVR